MPEAKIPNGQSDQEVMMFNDWKTQGCPHVKVINENIKNNKPPFESLGESTKKNLLAYVVYLRQNTAMPESEAPNVESAKDILDEQIEFKDEKEIDKHLAKQLSKAKTVGLLKPLTVSSKGIVKVYDGDKK